MSNVGELHVFSYEALKTNTYLDQIMSVCDLKTLYDAMQTVLSFTYVHLNFAVGMYTPKLDTNLSIFIYVFCNKQCRSLLTENFPSSVIETGFEPSEKVIFA